MNPFHPHKWAAVALLACSLLLAGCSRPMASITGKVTYMNKPLKGGSVSFVSAEGHQSVSGTIGEDGTYTIDKLPAGTYKVCVDTSFLKPATGSAPYKGSGGAKGPPPSATKGPAPKGPPADAVVPEGYKPSNPAEAAAAQNAKRYMEIPEKYKDADKTDLTHTVVGGPQTHNIELK